MASRQSIYKSETNSFNYILEQIPTGYSLKKQKFFKWLNENGYRRNKVAEKLHITDDELLKRLNEHGLFNKEQLSWLIKAMGARIAFEAIYFPSPEQKKQVEWEVFGKYKEEKKIE